MKYRMKPVVIKGEQWHPGKLVEGVIGYNATEGTQRHYSQSGTFFDVPAGCGWMDTPKGPRVVDPGDFVITGVEGERYPCKPELFEAVYEPISE